MEKRPLFPADVIMTYLINDIGTTLGRMCLLIFCLFGKYFQNCLIYQYILHTIRKIFFHCFFMFLFDQNPCINNEDIVK